MIFGFAAGAILGSQLSRAFSAGSITIRPNEVETKTGDNASVFRGENGAIALRAKGANDVIDIKYHADGSATVTVNGEEFEFTAEEAANLTVDGGDGNDTITVDLENSAGTNGLTIVGGNGDDSIMRVMATITSTQEPATTRLMAAMVMTT